ncbi:MAG: carboxyvinyl-carboxyphosphonate phosphorylmutase [Haliea sp.]|jgi:2-methylisocitrate lyase-like PEP mutase family enzyme|nr:carboxyvinyl-carboxyphosphonate phosphorylmutase [Haliea sp.]
MPTTHREQLADLLSGTQLVKAPGVYDGLSALLVEQAGFQCAFLSGGSLSFARFGRPDMGLVGASEVADTIAILRDRTSLPLIVDMDTGFGNALNVQRTVRDFERAGASAVQMEDQVSPKRCGHMAGKSVIDSGEMVGKIKAALDARENDGTLLVARTDALGVNGFEDAMERAARYLEAGADLLFIEAPKNLEQMQQIGKQFGDAAPLVHNLVEGGGSPTTDSLQLQQLGYRVALYPVALLHNFVPQARRVLEEIQLRGNTDSLSEQMCELADINQLLGADQLLAAGKSYDA